MVRSQTKDGVCISLIMLRSKWEVEMLQYPPCRGPPCPSLSHMPLCSQNTGACLISWVYFGRDMAWPLGRFVSLGDAEEKDGRKACSETGRGATTAPRKGHGAEARDGPPYLVVLDNKVLQGTPEASKDSDVLDIGRGVSPGVGAVWVSEH
ncbi:hypothetical protein VUR80DRAFT_923 [Thermomyces stellatus]